MIRVATFNIHHGAPPSRSVDHRALIASCASLDADVLALQEVDRRVWRTRLADQAGRVAWHLGAHHVFAENTSLGPLGRYGNALVVRGLIEHVDRLALASPAGRERRGAIVARVRVRGVATTVVCTHLHNEPAESGRPVARAQLAKLLGILAAAPRPLVLMGDLNLEPSEVLPVIEAAGLRRADTPPSFRSDGPSRRIDWIAVDGFDVESVEVPDLRTSDHRPVVAVLRQRSASVPAMSQGRPALR